MPVKYEIMFTEGVKILLMLKELHLEISVLDCDTWSGHSELQKKQKKQEKIEPVKKHPVLTLKKGIFLYSFNKSGGKIFRFG